PRGSQKFFTLAPPLIHDQLNTVNRSTRIGVVSRLYTAGRLSRHRKVDRYERDRGTREAGEHQIVTEIVLPELGVGPERLDKIRAGVQALLRRTASRSRLA